MKVVAIAAWLLTACAAVSAQTPPPPPPPPPASPASQLPARDRPFLPPAGSASITGRVVTDEEHPTPLRAVVVTLRGDGFRSGWTYVTDATGVFTFTGLPPGRFVLAASRAGFPSMNYGASRPGRPGASMVLKDTTVLEGLSIRLPRGAVITGHVFDEIGVPIAGARVTAGTIQIRNGQRSLGPGGSGLVFTDDRGEYRMFGLAAGDYAILTEARGLGSSVAVRRYSAAEIDGVLKRADSITAPGQPPPPPPSGQELAASPVYFPTVMSLAEAAIVHVSAGETRGDIDMRALWVPAVSISGTLLDPDGKPPANVVMNLVQIGATRGGPANFGHPSPKDGSFAFSGVTPGRYAITARATQPGERGSAQMPALWSRTDLEINGVAMSGINIRLQPGPSVTGSVAFQAISSLPPPSSIRVGLIPVASPGDISIGVADAIMEKDGTFAFTGVTPGRYRATALSPGSLASPLWNLQSATLNGQDVLDEPFEVTASDVSGLTLNFTDQITQINGSLEDATGRPAPDYYVIVFPADQKYWMQNSRRIKTARPGLDGTYVIRGLPPGTYRIGAVTDVEPGDWFEPTFLQQLLPASAEITISDGEKKTFPLKIGG